MMKNIYSFRRLPGKSPAILNCRLPGWMKNPTSRNRLWIPGGLPKASFGSKLLGWITSNQQNNKQPDGYFDFLDGYYYRLAKRAGDVPGGIEPFGSDLAAKFDPGTEQALISRYVYQPLYDSTKTIAQQFFPQLNRYVIKGTYSAQTGSRISAECH
jgi:cell surface protein SprA